MSYNDDSYTGVYEDEPVMPSRLLQSWVNNILPSNHKTRMANIFFELLP